MRDVFCNKCNLHLLKTGFMINISETKVCLNCGCCSNCCTCDKPVFVRADKYCELVDNKTDEYYDLIAPTVAPAGTAKVLLKDGKAYLINASESIPKVVQRLDKRIELEVIKIGDEEEERENVGTVHGTDSAGHCCGDCGSDCVCDRTGCIEEQVNANVGSSEDHIDNPGDDSCGDGGVDIISEEDRQIESKPPVRRKRTTKPKTKVESLVEMVEEPKE